ncbi:MAG: triose-phosphate isomerase [Chloroflexi bacterium]|nr:triose-phosphate isomerase [Chloroflexota bacterium]
MTRKPLVAGNWKMNGVASETRRLISLMKNELETLHNKVDIVICPPFTSLESAYYALGQSSTVVLGAQNLYFQAGGAYTGEISASMIKEFCSYVIIGHSERRTLLSESNDDINLKIQAALNSGLKVILCVGEDETARDNGTATVWVEKQLREGLKNIGNIANINITYEPIWAIGSGRAASGNDAQEMAFFIRKTLSSLYGKETQNTRILYGGSVKPENIDQFLQQADIDGALVGGASLQAQSFTDIVNKAAGQ